MPGQEPHCLPWQKRDLTPNKEASGSDLLVRQKREKRGEKKTGEGKRPAGPKWRKNQLFYLVEGKKEVY